MYLGKLKTSSNIAWHRPQSNTCRVEEELMQKAARALPNTTDPLERLRLLCLTRGAAGILVLARIFRSLDNGSRQLDKDAFFHGIQETGLDFSHQDAMELFERFDKNNTGHINIDEFINNVRPSMSESRRAIVDQAFRKLDKSGDGHTTVADIRAAYDVTSNPRYMSGEETGDLILKTFLECFQTLGVEDGKVTLEEFMNFYSGISVSIDNDCYFDLMIRQAYKL